MTIHHATIKSAASKGVVLEQRDDVVEAHHTAQNIRVTRPVEEDDNATELAKDALNSVLQIVDFHAENPTIVIGFEDDDFVAYKRKGAGRGDELARDPDLEDLFVTLAERDAEEDAEETESTGSVVPDIYKKRYAERGDPTHCGDWLALKLNDLCKVTDGKKVTTDLDRLETIATANGVEAARVDRLGTATNGWQGRYRMTVRNMLTKVVAAKGFLFVPEGAGVKQDTELKAPREWVVEHSPKPKAPAAKTKSETKKEAKAKGA